MTQRLRWIIVTGALIAVAACRSAGTHHLAKVDPDARAGAARLPGAVDSGAVVDSPF